MGTCEDGLLKEKEEIMHILRRLIDWRRAAGLLAAAALVFSLNGPASGATAEESDLIFDYAEAAYAPYLAPSGAVSQAWDIYYYRYYPGTGAYLATANDRLLYLGPASGGQILDLGAAPDWLSVSQGLLAGSLNFSGPYPALATVSYTNASNVVVSATAYPGQVMLHFNVSAAWGGTAAASLAQREAAIAANGGAVIEKIPLIGFYLAQVQAGQENAFIQAMRGGGYGVDVAVPNRAAVRGEVYIDDSCWIVTCTTPGGTPAVRYVPINVGGGGMVVVDDFKVFAGSNHGQDVYNTAVGNGGNVSARVQLPVSDDGSIPNDKIVASIVAVQQGAAIYAPGQNVIANVSFNAGGEDSAWYPEYWSELATMTGAAMQSLKSQLPAGQQDKFLLVQEIGNSGQDISSAFGTVYDAQAASGLTANHLYVGGSDGAYATQVGDAGYHDKAAWYPGTIRPGVFGSSFAAPAVAAFIDQVARQGNVSLDRARSAVMQALQANPGGTAAQIVAAALAAIPPVAISPAGQSFGRSGGSGSIDVTALTGQSWTASSNASWLAVMQGSGSGNGTVSYSVGANSGSPIRVGTLTVGGQTFTVTQEGDAGVTGYWSGVMTWPSAPVAGCGSQTVPFSLSLTEDTAMNLSGYTSNSRTITSGSRNGNAVTVTLDTMFGARGPYTWSWDGVNTITGSMAYFCYSLDTGALLFESTETFSVTRQ